MKLLNLLEQMIKDRTIWVNAKTREEVEVREENLVDTMRTAYDRFGLPADFADRKATTRDIINALIVRKWVSVKVVAGGTWVHAATTELAQQALQYMMNHVPTRDVLVEVGAVGQTEKIELHGKDQVRAFVQSGEVPDNSGRWQPR